MKPIATTRMSSKGQVVIPEEIRIALKLNPGDQFIVLGENDVVILKMISTPSMKDFDHIIEKARKQAHVAGITKDDVGEAIKLARKKHKK